MKSILLIAVSFRSLALILTFSFSVGLFVSSNVCAQTEASGDANLAAGKYAEALSDYTKEWAQQKQAGRERLADKLAKALAGLSKAPPIPEQAELYYQMGIAFMKLAKSSADFGKAADEFGYACFVVPWVFDFRFNHAVARKKEGDLDRASASAKLARILAQNDKDRRDAIALRAEIEASQEMADAEKARQNSPAGRAAAMLEILQSKWSGPVTQLLICGVRLNDYWKCNDEEAKGSNWVDSGNVRAYPQPARGSIVYKLVGEDLINMKLGDYGRGEPYREGCARLKPYSDDPWPLDPNRLIWVNCPGRTDAGQPDNIRVNFGKTKDGASVIEFTDSCGGNFSSSCRRATFTLKPYRGSLHEIVTAFHSRFPRCIS